MDSGESKNKKAKKSREREDDDDDRHWGILGCTKRGTTPVSLFCDWVIGNMLYGQSKVKKDIGSGLKKRNYDPPFSLSLSLFPFPFLLFFISFCGGPLPPHFGTPPSHLNWMSQYFISFFFIFSLIFHFQFSKYKKYK